MNKVERKKKMRSMGLATQRESRHDKYATSTCDYCERDVRHPCSRKSLARICPQRPETAQ